MTYTYVYQKCTDCGTCLLVDAERCWYCDGQELEEKQVEWTVREPS